MKTHPPHIAPNSSPDGPGPGQRRNPTAPTPAEGAAIRSLLETCEEALGETARQMRHASTIRDSGEARSAEALAARKRCESELRNAAQLRIILERTLLDIKEMGLGLETPSAAPAALAGETRARDQGASTTLGISLSGSAAILATVRDLADRSRQADSAIRRWDSELRTAQTVVDAAEKKFGVMQSHLQALEDLKSGYQHLVRPIWTVPDDVWIEIFAHCTDTASKAPAMDGSWITDPKTRYAALRISWVCQRWRSIAHASPRLWTNIAVFDPGDRLFRRALVEHHDALSKEMPRNLLVHCGRNLSNNPQSRMTVTFDASPINLVAVVVPAGGQDEKLLRTLQALPPCSSLWLLQDDKGDHRRLRPYHVTLPSRLSSNLRHLYTQSVKVDWEDEADVNLTAYTLDLSRPVLQPSYGPHTMWPVHRFIPSSVSSLTDLELINPPNILCNLQGTEPVVFPRLKTLRICLSGLIQHFGQMSSAPQLHVLTILDGRHVSAKNYLDTKVGEQFTSLQVVGCTASNQMSSTVALFVMDLKALRTLALRGEGSEEVLSLVAQALPQSDHGLSQLSLVEMYSTVETPHVPRVFWQEWTARNQELREPASLVVCHVQPDGRHAPILPQDDKAALGLRSAVISQVPT